MVRAGNDAHSKSAPVPVSGYALGRLDSLLEGVLGEAHRDGRGRGVDDGTPGCRTKRLSLCAGIDVQVAAAPRLELSVAMCAGAAHLALGVEASILVERDLEAAVVVAKDVAALAAVVAACKVGKVALASRIFAHDRLVVGLDKFCVSHYIRSLGVGGAGAKT